MENEKNVERPGSPESIVKFVEPFTDDESDQGDVERPDSPESIVKFVEPFTDDEFDQGDES